MTVVQDTRFMLLFLCGIFTVVLGVTHFVYPRLFYYRLLIYSESNQGVVLEPFRLWFITYPLDLDVAYRIIWLMNHHVSFVLVSIGFVDLVHTRWLLGDGRPLLLWITAWWWLRAGLQFTLGRQARDWFWLAVFSGLGVVHLWAGLAGTGGAA